MQSTVTATERCDAKLTPDGASHADLQFEAMDTTGAEVKDSVEATNEEEAQQKIRQMGYFVTKITEVGQEARRARKARPRKAGKARRAKTFAIGGVRSKQLVTFTRQFSTLQDAGLPVLRSLKILEDQMKPGVLKNALIDVVDDVESGSTLSEAFGKHPKCFDRLYVNMVKAGEAGGALEVILKRLAEFKEKAAEPASARSTGPWSTRRGHHRGRRHLDVHHDLHHPEVREDLQGLQA